MENPNNYPWMKIVELENDLINHKSINGRRELIINSAKLLFGGTINLWLPEFKDIQNHKINSVVPLESQYALSQPMLAAFTHKYVMVGDLKDSYKFFDYSSFTEANFAAAPIIYNDIGFGVLEINREVEKPLIRQEIELLQTFTRQTAFSLYASLRIKGDNRQLNMLRLVQSVSSQISNIVDLEKLSVQVTRLILDAFHKN